ncbi:hypothetical protein PV11_04841 [Exophiala sideris]|uniref:Ig-like domain-containing protein n=1 Tax=Exophiala sideris TaxID=1016849 RepID=A0A0D1YNL2_9EURO|nr:hypothetical protein PV11_04841 [Exophiala sideris]
MSTAQSSRQRPQPSTSPTLVALLAILFAPHLAHAATQLTFFEHSSCNAGTSFARYNDAGTLQSDTSCHQTANGTVALYVNGIDSGCTVRTYQSTNCDPSASSLAGLDVSLGTCFYVEEGVTLGSWRPDCSGVDYSSTNGEDQGSSYASSSSSITGVITLTASSTSSSSSTSMSSSTQTTAASSSASGSSTATQATSVAGSGSATGSSSVASKTASSDAISTIGLSLNMLMVGSMGLVSLAALRSLC